MIRPSFIEIAIQRSLKTFKKDIDKLDLNRFVLMNFARDAIMNYKSIVSKKEVIK